MENVERYECKFLISPREATRIKALIQPYCQLDPASTDGPYSIISLYYDSDQLTLYQVTKRDRAQRLKLRVRTYGGNQVFLEIKRKSRGMIWKSRARLSVDAWCKLSSPAPRTSRASLYTAIKDQLSSTEYETFKEFMYWRDRYDAQPSAWIAYRREAYFAPDEDYARITFDDQLRAALPLREDHRLFTQGDQVLRWRRVDFASQLKSLQPDVILELKSTRSVPSWMVDLTRELSSSSVGVSKYCLGVESLSEFRSHRAREYFIGLSARHTTRRAIKS